MPSPTADDPVIEQEFSDEQQEVLNSIRGSRIVLPILIGVGVVLYLLYKQFDPDEFARFDWTTHTTVWVLASLTLLVVRHMAYATRLRVLSRGAFSWRKCIELIFIWEFSSAVSPTSLGGSTVAFFVLAQERLSTAKTAAIVLYTVILDTAFFVLTLPVLFLLFGTNMIRPGMQTLGDMDGWGYYFILAYVLMLVYGSVFYYGLFHSPRQIRRLLVWVTGFKWLRRFRSNAEALGSEMILAGAELRREKFGFHALAFLSTATAWSCRFLLLSCLIVAFFPDLPRDVLTQLGLYARLETMFVIVAFSPTPGGAGFVEVLFTKFLTDYVPNATYSTIIAFLWRLFTYYSYLLVGAFIIPNWLRQTLNRRKAKRRARIVQSES